MLYFYSKPMFGGDRFTDSDDLLPMFGGFAPVGPTPDRAIDSALRSVPLPEGLMTRLGMLAYTIPDESSDQVDYLGC